MHWGYGLASCTTMPKSPQQGVTNACYTGVAAKTYPIPILMIWIPQHLKLRVVTLQIYTPRSSRSCVKSKSVDHFSTKS